MWILSSRGNNNISLVWQPHLWNELFLPLEDVSSTTSLYVYLPCWIFWKFTVTKLSLSRRLCSWKNPRVCMSSWAAIPIVPQPGPMDILCSLLDGSRPMRDQHLRIKSKDQYRGCDSAGRVMSTVQSEVSWQFCLFVLQSFIKKSDTRASTRRKKKSREDKLEQERNGGWGRKKVEEVRRNVIQKQKER